MSRRLPVSPGTLDTYAQRARSLSGSGSPVPGIPAGRRRAETGGAGRSRAEGRTSVTEDSSHEAWLRQARSHLRDADPVLARLIDDRPDFDPRAWMAQLPPMDLYGALLFQITGQQLSVAATRRTLSRIEALFGGHLPSPAELLGLDPDQLRAAGDRKSVV